MRPKKRANVNRQCKGCAKSIENKHINAKFCCQRCKDNYHNLTNPRGFGLDRLNDDLWGEPEDAGWDAHKSY